MDAPWTIFLPDCKPDRIRRAVADIRQGKDELWMVLVAEGGAPDLGTLVAALRESGLRFFGGIFPEVLQGRERRREGVLLVRLPGNGDALAIKDLEHPENDLRALARSLPEVGHGTPTAIILVDALAPHISKLLETTYDRLGSHVRYWGGGAGSLSLEPKPYLFTQDGALCGGAVMALTSLEARLGVRHGWRSHRGPFVATRTRGNVIEQLNWRVALDVYMEQVGRPGDVGLGASALADITRGHPFGIQRQGQELVVRDPVGLNDSGALVCVGDVPQNAVLSILRGDPETLVAAAEEAAHEAASGATCGRLCLLADCISRVIFLGERFNDELAAIERGLSAMNPVPTTCGMLTLGEISSRGDGYLELFNKTCVVAVLHEA